MTLANITNSKKAGYLAEMPCTASARISDYKTIIKLFP